MAPIAPPPPNTPHKQPAIRRVEQMLRSKPSLRAREVYFGISCQSFTSQYSSQSKCHKQEDRNQCWSSSTTQRRYLQGRTYTSSPMCMSSLLLTDASLQGIIQVSMCCPSNNQAPEPQLPMKQFPKQGTNYSSPQQDKKNHL